MSRARALLVGQPTLAALMARHGAPAYLLRILVAAGGNGTQAEAGERRRVAAAGLLGKLMAELSSADYTRSTLEQLGLPAAFVSMVQEDPQEAVRQFDSNHETPELLWSEAGVSSASFS